MFGGGLQPRERGIDHAIGASLGKTASAACARRVTHVVIVEVEAAVQAIAAIEHQCTDEGRCCKTVRAKALGQGRDVVIESELRVRMDAVAGRVKPGHQGRV